jgi:hypothetical protein
LAYEEIFPCFGLVGCAEKHRSDPIETCIGSDTCAVAHPSASPGRLNLPQLELLRGEIAMTVIVVSMILLGGLVATTAAMELGALTHLGS